MKKNTIRWIGAFALIVSVSITSCAQLGISEDEAQNEETTQLLALAAATALEQLALNGNWSDSFSGSHVISASKSMAGGTTGSWVSTTSSGATTNATVVEFDNSTKTVYTKTDVPSWCTSQGTSYPACPCFDAKTCYNRNVWTVDASGSTYYCQIVYNKPSLSEAKSDTTTADSSNPSASGCGSFSWTKLTRK